MGIFKVKKGIWESRVKKMPMRKVWDHTIDLKEIFKSKKEKIYPLLKNKREKIQKFVND